MVTSVGAVGLTVSAELDLLEVLELLRDELALLDRVLDGVLELLAAELALLATELALPPDEEGVVISILMSDDQLSAASPAVIE